LREGCDLEPHRLRGDHVDVEIGEHSTDVFARGARNHIGSEHRAPYHDRRRLCSLAADGFVKSQRVYRPTDIRAHYNIPESPG
jgi:hypothetical protein